MDDINAKNKDNSDIEIDPDYESTNSAIWRAELQEEEGKSFVCFQEPTHFTTCSL